MNQKSLALVLRFLVFALFVFSAIAKMFPIWAFEKQLVDLGLFSWCMAPNASRALIGLELAIGIAIIQPHYLRRIVIPVTILLLIAFCVHLSIEMVKHGAMNGNCGCFGQLLPMTPLEAFIKNVVTIGIMAFLYTRSSDLPSGRNRFSVLLIIWLFSTLFMFVAFPFCPCNKTATDEITSEAVVSPSVFEELETSEDSVQVVDSVGSSTPAASDSLPKDSIVAAKPVNPGPAQVKSRFSDVNVFSGKKVNLDKGKKIVCFFAAGCNHCQEAARELNKLSKKGGFPPIVIYFMDEETHLIPDFFKFAGKEFPYRVLDIPQFWTMIGPDGSTPGVFYLWNGNIIKYFVGTEEKAFKPELLEKALESSSQ